MAIYDKFLGDPIVVKVASEPSDIIWENRQFTATTRKLRMAVVYFIILILLACSGTFIYYCQTKALTYKNKYPVVNCEELIREDYGGDWTGRLQEDAVREYKINRQYELSQKPFNYFGPMQCYCTKLAKEKPDEVKKPMEVQMDKDGNGSPTSEWVPVCQLYEKDKILNVIISSSISFIIIAINTLLRSIVIIGIRWVRQHTYSEQLASITNGVFYAQFFNTGLIILFVNANLSEHAGFPLYYLAKQLAGSFYDYSPQWYADVGFKIVQTMIIQSIIPYVTLVSGFAVPYLLRFYDSKFTGDKYITRKITMQ